MKRLTCRTIVVVALGLLAGACQNLDVTDTNAPDRARALANPADVEALVGSTWMTWWGRMENSSSLYYALPTVADEGTATYANGASLELSSEPRPIFNNNPTADAQDIARFAWEDFNEMLSNTNETLAAVEGGLEFESPARDIAFAHFGRGLALGYLALMYDKAYVTNWKTDYTKLPEPEPYPMVQDSAIAALETAIAIMDTSDFTIPDDWMHVSGMTSTDLAKIANSYIVRILAYTPRTPKERDAVDWDDVLAHIQKGITTDLAPVQDGEAIYGYYWYYMTNNGSFTQYADYKLIGPSDVSGNYQTWLSEPLQDRQPFLITTPDRRITGVDAGGNPDPTADGTYFEYHKNIPFTQARGIYHFSHYQWNRNHTQWNPGGSWYEGPAHIMTVDEMNLIAAEAYYHKGMLQKAADMINTTRVAHGGLPPVTINGVPDAPDCVPRPQEDPAGPCGTLLDALKYERMIELAGMDAARTWLDRRGFGTLPDGTFLELPIPGRELGSLKQPIYTFGGVGGACAAGSTDNETTC